MSENFLSFVVNAAPKTAGAESDVPGNPASVGSQPTEFAEILKKEQSQAPQFAGTTDDSAQALEDSLVKAAAGNGEESATTTQAPVTLPVLPASGNGLPELSIHSRGLQVGRVILTTANPKVSEESLNQFAQNQSADTTPAVLDQPVSQTQGILQGLMEQQPPPPVGEATLPAAAATKSESGNLAAGLKAEATLTSSAHPRQAFGDWRQHTQAINPSATQTNSPSQAKSDAGTNVDGLELSKEAIKAATGEARDTGPKLPLSTQMLTQGAPERLLEPMPPSGSSDVTPQAPKVSAVPAANTAASAGPGTLTQGPVTTVAGGLVDALTATDNAQMQSRLQPYQAWAQRFGEVLAQKLSLAVKDGNWSVKLNLNPAALGPVGVDLQVHNGGIEGQIAANDANVRQLLNDSLPRLRQALEALVSDNGGVNIELNDHRENGAKQQREADVEIAVDLMAEEFIPLEAAIADGNILRDGLNVVV